MDSLLANESSDNIVISDNWVPRVGMEFDLVDHAWNFCYLLSSQRKITEVQDVEIELADDSGIRPRAAHEFIGAHVGGSNNLGYTHRDHKNYLRTKRQRDYVYGEAGILLKYFHLQTIENPSFQYSLQLDCEEQITNIFWADAKMLIDYASFGDVVAFGTTFGTNKEHRQLGVFVGFNHFGETTVFGAALLYDETTESFKWLFETFLATHGNKHPKTIFTDQDIAMGKAIAEVMPKVWHGLCTWHITENATKHLLRYGSAVLQEFKACMYEIKEEVEFEKAFEVLRGKVTQQSCTQLSESFNKDLKGYLKCTLDIMRFFKQFERVVGLKRQNETNNEFDTREKLPSIKMQRSPLLRQVGQIYTPNIFEAFQDEYDWSMAAYIKQPVEGQLRNEYRVAILDLETDNSIDKEYQVLSDPLTETISCSCKMFERLGILCAHALKVLDTMNIKLVPAKYILKRWTREARAETVQDIFGRIILEDPQLDATRRYKALCQKFVKMASRASKFVESSSLVESGLNNLIVEVEKLLLNLKIKMELLYFLRRMQVNNKRKKSKKKVSSDPNRENIPPQEGENQVVLPQQFMSFGNNYPNFEVPCSSYTQLLGAYGSQAQPYFDLWAGTSFPYQLYKMALSVSVYFLWLERNCRIFNHATRNSTEIIKSIQLVVATRCLHMKKLIDPSVFVV
ncbi:protein FAR1-RELATED SEQUENCE 5-like [Spinacia oleracea]|uniref:Protein FAR1-RELATED SEQUENCE 5-like n=1 Tax=Spinacia oleracea TaxID=3562 RepID=A0ABM3RS72_SPIOL|nr:protein FAR1-RELATED SEQUENCE 5-like [Spinacia oleracea]